MRLVFSYVVFALLLFACTAKKSEKKVTLIPKPSNVVVNKGEFKFNDGVKVFVENNSQVTVAKFLTERLSKVAGITTEIVKGKSSGKEVMFVTDESVAKEGYKLAITPKQIKVSASANTGFFYGIQSIIQMLPHEVYGDKLVKDADWSVRAVTIEDKPNFEWRGIHLDVSRHFFTVAEVKKMLDYMAMYKLNKFHWHLTDDQGWRIEIKKYPLLTEKGAWREHNKQDKICIERSKEDTTFKIAEKNYHMIDSKKMYGGFYTQEDIRDIVKYAADRQIEIIPEIDIPGHFSAAISNYPYLSCSNKAGWGTTFSYPACVGKETTYDFIQNVLSEVAELFPSKYLHIGGDEVKKDEWIKCKHCQAEIKKHKLKDEHELQSLFNERIEKFLKSKGKTLMGWDEIVEGGATKDAAIMWWRNWAPKMRNKAADNGNKLVMTPDFEYYFDFTYEATPLKKTYNYNPIPDDFTAKQAESIMGVQGNLWSEWIPRFSRLQHQAFPRMAAMAEAGWTPQSQKNYEDFYSRVLDHLNKYDVMGIYYHLPPLTGLNKTIVFVDTPKVEIGIPMEDMKVFYTLDGSTPDENSKQYKAPFNIYKKCVLKARALRNNIWGSLYKADFDKQSYRIADKPKDVKQGGVNRFVINKMFKRPKDITDYSKLKSSVVKEINLGEFRGKDGYALIFEGYIKVEKKGLYEFITASDDGDVFYIGDKLVVNNGGSHATRERSGMIALDPGLHKFTHKYIQRGGGYELKIWIKEPGSKRRKIKADEMFY